MLLTAHFEQAIFNPNLGEIYIYRVRKGNIRRLLAVKYCTFTGGIIRHSLNILLIAESLRYPFVIRDIQTESAAVTYCISLNCI